MFSCLYLIFTACFHTWKLQFIDFKIPLLSVTNLLFLLKKRFFFKSIWQFFFVFSSLGLFFKYIFSFDFLTLWQQCLNKR